MSSSPPLVVADRYRLVAPLGQGGMGRVWRATDVVLHRDVAIKELVPPPGLTPDERREMRERSLREARAIARLNNINVVRVFDVLRTDADPWIVMEYVPSRSLQDTLASDGPYPPVRAAEIGLGVLGALRAAHRAGVVHRDVKPGNVLIGEDGRVVLTDFGLATVPGDPTVTRTGLVLGSPAYIAPERARDGTAGPGADLWSLGATLYAAVEGASPFARPSAIATLAALATENPPPARNAGPLKPVLNGLLRKDPTHRINADEAERLLLRATGRRSKLTFPMSPTMRRPGVGRERPSLPPVGPASSAAAAPVVPGPRPPVSPASPPAQPPADSRPVFAPGKASVGRRPADTPTRVDGPKVEPLDATRVDAQPIKDKPVSSTGTAPSSGTQTPEASASGPAPGATMRGSRSAFGSITADEVAAHRKRTAAARAATREAAAPSPPATDPSTPAAPPPAAARPAAATPVAGPPAAATPAAGTTKAEPPAAGTRPPDQRTGGTPAAPTRDEPASADRLIAVPATRPGTADEEAAAERAAEAALEPETPPSEAAAPATAPGTSATALIEPAASATAPSEPAAPEDVDSTSDAARASAPTENASPADSAARRRRGAGDTGGPRAESPPIVEPTANPATAAATDTGAAAVNAAGTADAAAHAAGTDAAAHAAGTDAAAHAAGTDADAHAAGSTDGTATADGAPTDTAHAGGAGQALDTAASEPRDTGDSVASRAEAADQATETAQPEKDGQTDGPEAAGPEDTATVRRTNVNKPAVGARAGATGSRASRKKGRGRTTAAGVAAASKTGAVTSATDPAAQPTTGAAAHGLAETVAGQPKPAAEPESAAPAATAPEAAANPTEPAATLTEAAGKPTAPSEAAVTPAGATESGAAAQAETDLASPAEQPEPSTADDESKNTSAKVTAPRVPAARATDRKATTASLPAAKIAAAKAATASDTALAEEAEKGTGTEPDATKIAASSAQTGGATGAQVGAAEAARAPTSPASLPLGSTRPAWRPMPVPATGQRDKGLTIFGTTLSRRQAAIGGAVLVAIVLALVLIVSRAFGGGSDNENEGSKAGVVPAASATGRATTSAPAAPAPTTTAPTSAAPSPSASTGTGAVTLPPGWHLYADASGFKVPVPANWKVWHQGTETYFQEEGGQYRLLIVDQTTTPAPDPVADWTSKESDRISGYRNYHRISIKSVDYWDKAADWEFTRTSSSGNPLHVVKRGFITAKNQAYGITWSTSEKDWNANKANLELIYQGFVPFRS